MKKLRNSQFMLAVVIYGLEELQLVKRSDIITNLKLKTQFPEVATVTKNKAVDCNGGRLAFSWLRIYSFNVLHLFHVRNMEHETIGLWTNTNYTLSLFSNTKMEEELHDLHSDGYKQLLQRLIWTYLPFGTLGTWAKILLITPPPPFPA